MAKMKELIASVLDVLVMSNMDYEYTASVFNMSPEDVYTIAKEYGDVE